ncbi:arsenic metallochaperone ArsD family protein [Sedimentibacter sp. zth1]|uniref:arsenic metallochaperone ArsD family protein n=1 Tax=Sedimentibacter sp. zth1 TaxID=2816908 RepID=UPI001A91F603|nr:arsenic metallochaperone ArsD family protein [Sedimentibacter sp. zth1]QSX05832.1 arsenic metallochaperone ArsD family protein [Sedimentibacter sp. zth1]
MNIIQIYNTKKLDDDIMDLVDKLKLAGVDINCYNYFEQSDEFNKNLKIERLLKSYGESIFPVTLVNGEVVEVEKMFSKKELISNADISVKKLNRVGIDLSIFRSQCNSKDNSENCNCKNTNCFHNDNECQNKKNCSEKCYEEKK